MTSGTLRVEVPRVYLPLLKPARYKGAWGGRGSAKSHFFAERLILRMVASPTRAVCIREVQLSLKESVKRLLEDKIEALGLQKSFRILNTEIHCVNSGIVIFTGMQNHTADSIKSLEGFDVAWVEEAQSLSQRSLDLLRPTIRKEGSELWFSWNPRKPTDPIDRLLRSKHTPPDARVIKTNWRDNPWFPTVLRADLLWDRQRDHNKYLHVWEGEYEKVGEAQVFKNWRVEAFDTPREAQFLYGGDYGFAVDPTVLIRCFVEGRTLYVDHEVYEVGCEIDHTPALYDSLACAQAHVHAVPCSVTHARPVCRIVETHDPTHCVFDHTPCSGSHCDAPARQWRITADSARPETISYLHNHGYPKIEAAKKGAGSVEEGIEFLKNYDIVVHPRCAHTIEELTYYSFKRNTLTGEVIPVLEDANNHVIDSLRYAVETLRRDGPFEYAKAGMVSEVSW